MKTTQHTPGPWHLEKHSKIVWQDSGGPGNETYATQHPIILIVHEQLGDPRLRTCVAQLDNSTEAEGNARLITASPDLLSVLEQLVDELEVRYEDVDLQAARAAISKAKSL